MLKQSVPLFAGMDNEVDEGNITEATRNEVEASASAKKKRRRQSDDMELTVTDEARKCVLRRSLTC